MTAPRRRWLQFRLKTIFVVVAIVAVPCGLFKWKWDRKQAERRAVAEIRQAGGHVGYDWHFDTKQKKPQPRGPAFLRKLLGEDFLAHVVQVQFISVNPHGANPTPQIDDEPLVWLESLSDVETLDLRNSNVTDAGMEHLQGLSRLRYLVLNNTKVTGVGLRHVKQAKGLRVLGLQSLPITDADLVQLAAFPDLEELVLYGTEVTNESVAELQKHLPKCKITQ